MTDIQKKLEARIAASQAMLKIAGEGESVEKAKDPEALIGAAADVQVEDNKPAGVEIPGEAGLSADGETTPCRGTDIGHVEVNGPEISCNEEVDDIIESAKEVEKTASAMIEFASQLLAIPDAAFAGVTKTASAEITDADVEQYIVKRASEGDAIAQGWLNYCAMMHKVANGVPAEDVVAGAEIEANVADATAQVAQALLEENPEMDEETAQQIAEQSVAEVLDGALQEGGEVEGGAEDIDSAAIELAEEIKANLVAEGLDEAEAEAAAIQAVSDVVDEAAGVEKEASAEEELPVEDEVSADIGDEAAQMVVELAQEVKAADPSISDEEALDGAADAVTEAIEEAQSGEVEAGGEEDAVGELASQMVMELAEDIKAQDPSISDEEALDGAADAVADALETANAQQAVGAVDASGAPVVDDEAAAAIVDELGKTASAYPLRGALTTTVNMNLGLSPEAFAARLGVQA